MKRIQSDNRFCRNCPHHRDGHINYVHLHFIKDRLVRQACYGDQNETPTTCPCQEYVPKENLEYLEYLYDKGSLNEKK